MQEMEGGAVSQIRRLFIEEILVMKKCVSKNSKLPTFDLRFIHFFLFLPAQNVICGVTVG